MKPLKNIRILFLLVLCSIGCAIFADGLNNDRAWWDKGQQETDRSTTPERQSLYVPMSDGTRIAVTYYLPSNLPSGTRLPSILIQTRYFRAFAGNWPFRAAVEGPSELVSRFIAAGYAVVSVDVRGTGASFGNNPYPWSKKEIQDGYEMVDWIISQSWSDGKVGATGISYDGTSAEFLLSTKHPAVKAIAPRFSLFDAYTDIAFPGGVFHRWFVKNWAEGNKAMDANVFHRTLGMFGSLALGGVLPVDSDSDRALLRQAIEEHKANLDIYAEARQIVFRDDPAPSGFLVDDLSPFTVADKLAKTNKPILSMSGWLDGGYAHAAAKRFLTVPNLGSRLIIGPWDHGGRQNISPLRRSVKPSYDQVGELLRFFDLHLKGENRFLEDEPDVFYYTLVEERWKASDAWPPLSSETLTYYLAPGNRLSTNRPKEQTGSDRYAVDFSVGTGPGSRWRSLYNIEKAPIAYPDRGRVGERLLVYESAPVPVPVEITGHPVVHLYASSSEGDGSLFVYLEEVTPEGEVNYISDGQLRIIHRALSVEDPPYKSPAPYRTFKRNDASLVAPGEIADLRFDLLPTSYLIRKGHKIRLAIAGADIDYFANYPKDKPPTYHLFRTSRYDSRILLPYIPSPD